VQSGKNVGRTWHGERGRFGIGRGDVYIFSLALAVSERPGEDTGILGGMLSDVPLATAPTSKREGIREAELLAPDDEVEAIGIGEGLAPAMNDPEFIRRRRGHIYPGIQPH